MLFVVAALVTGCRSVPFEPKAERHIEGFGTIYFEDAKDAERVDVAAVFWMAKDQLIRDGVATEAELSTLVNVETYVYADTGDDTWGHYNKFLGIEVTDDLLSLTHEIGHHLQVQRALELGTDVSERMESACTAEHHNWDKNGINASSERFKERVYNYWRTLATQEDPPSKS